MSIRQLFSQTAIYGMTTIVGRLLNYLLVPLHTRIFDEQNYGIVTNVYAYVGLLMILFSYRLESAFFRYGTSPDKRAKVFGTGLRSLMATSVLLALLMIALSGSIAKWLKYPHHQDIVIYMALVLALDACTAIPFALLRMEDKALAFGRLKLINIAVNIGANVLFLVVFPLLGWYDEGLGVAYIFIANLLASAVTFVMVRRETAAFARQSTFDNDMWHTMLAYSAPLVFVGIAGIINEVFDRILLEFMLSGAYDERMAQVGIYGACYKLAMLMTMFTQAFNFASEPFFFRYAAETDKRDIYAQVAKAFAIVGCIVFLGVTLYIDVFKYFIGARFRVGLGVVPILLLANLALGLYYSVAAWYKLVDKTIIGTYISLFGAAVTIVANVALIPLMGYMGSAWATLICYAGMLVLAWWWGRKYFPVAYDLTGMGQYIGLALAGFGLSYIVRDAMQMPVPIVLVVNTAIMGAYLLFVMNQEKISPDMIMNNLRRILKR